ASRRPQRRSEDRGRFYRQKISKPAHRRPASSIVCSFVYAVRQDTWKGGIGFRCSEPDATKAFVEAYRTFYLHAGLCVPDKTRRVAVRSGGTQTTHVAGQISDEIFWVAAFNYVSDTKLCPRFYGRTLVEIAYARIDYRNETTIFRERSTIGSAQAVTIFGINAIEFTQHCRNLSIVKVNTAEVHVHGWNRIAGRIIADHRLDRWRIRAKGICCPA